MMCDCKQCNHCQECGSPCSERDQLCGVCTERAMNLEDMKSVAGKEEAAWCLRHPCERD